MEKYCSSRKFFSGMEKKRRARGRRQKLKMVGSCWVEGNDRKRARKKKWKIIIIIHKKLSEKDFQFHVFFCSLCCFFFYSWLLLAFIPSSFFSSTYFFFFGFLVFIVENVFLFFQSAAISFNLYCSRSTRRRRRRWLFAKQKTENTTSRNTYKCHSWLLLLQLEIPMHTMIV